ncbi:hypothetical protein D0T12_21755 [Actinomadura spongiicola]|uniref:Uncharacterized protein n=1 Tax=Actinomadura spongiicola TaxID=2303421 RepID=A0A372GE61_9ACTN|nr:hypothetical protein D0T12_21755 [Actinomadura spongiicola]
MSLKTSLHRIGCPSSSEDASLAVQALDYIVAPESDVRQLWAPSPKYEAWVSEVKRIRAVLLRGSGAP